MWWVMLNTNLKPCKVVVNIKNEFNYPSNVFSIVLDHICHLLVFHNFQPEELDSGELNSSCEMALNWEASYQNSDLELLYDFENRFYETVGLAESLLKELLIDYPILLQELRTQVIQDAYALASNESYGVLLVTLAPKVV